jgi:hypothetical protein
MKIYSIISAGFGLNGITSKDKAFEMASRLQDNDYLVVIEHADKSDYTGIRILTLQDNVFVGKGL